MTSETMPERGQWVAILIPLPVSVTPFAKKMSKITGWPISDA